MSHQLIKMYQQVIDEDTDYQMENHSTANMNKSLKHDEIANSFNVLFGYLFFFTYTIQQNINWSRHYCASMYL